MDKSEQNSGHNSTYRECESHISPSRTSQTTTEKMTVMPILRTLEDMTERTNDQKIHLSQLLLDL